jgi:hypothetical protein
MAAPLASFLGAIVFVAMTAYTRSGEFGSERARESRYVYVVVALALPAAVLGLDVLTRGRRVARLLVFGCFAVALVGNVRVFSDQRRSVLTAHQHQRQTVLHIAHDPLARDVPPSLRPQPGINEYITVGWLLSGAESGRIPRPNPNDAARLSATLHLALTQKETSSTPAECLPLRVPMQLTVDPGDTFWVVDGAVYAIAFDDDDNASYPKRLDSDQGSQVAVAAPLRLELRPATRSARVCPP